MKNALQGISLLFLFSCSQISPSKRAVSIMGFDSDKDGVRDDLQSWIDDKYNPTSRVRLALRGIAKIHPSSCNYKYSLECLESIVGLEERLKLEIELFEKTLDSETRRSEYEGKLIKCPQLNERVINTKCRF